MSEQRSFERYVADSLAGERRGVPLHEERYRSVHDLARRTRQQPRWLALITEPPMRIGSSLIVGSPVLQAAAVLVVTMLLASLMVGIGVAGQTLLAPDEPIVVDQSGGGDYTTISEAVDAAEEGATILVRPGRYRESVVVMGKDLTVTGDGGRDEIVIEAATGTLPVDFAPASGELAPDLPTLIPAGEPYAFGVLLVDTSSQLTGLTVQAQQVGTAIPIIGRGSSPALDDIVIRVPGPASGHWLSVNWTEGTGGTLRNSEVEGWLAVGADTDVTIEGNTLPATCLVAWETSAELVIRGNTIHGCPYEKGIDINEGNDVLIEGNDISVEDVPPEATVDGYSGGRAAVQVWGPEGSVAIRDNELYDSVYGIIVSEEGPELEVSDNRIHDNGVGISGIDDSTLLRGNVIEGNVTGADIGFFVSPTLERNVIRANQVGLSIEGNSDPVFLDNTICGNEIPVLSPTGQSFDISTSEVCDDEQPG